MASINGDALIAFDASQTDVFFKNAVAIGDDVLGVFNEGTYDEWATYSYAVDAHYFDSETKESRLPSTRATRPTTWSMILKIMTILC